MPKNSNRRRRSLISEHDDEIDTLRLIVFCAEDLDFLNCRCTISPEEKFVLTPDQAQTLLEMGREYRIRPDLCPASSKILRDEDKCRLSEEEKAHLEKILSGKIGFPDLEGVDPIIPGLIERTVALIEDTHEERVRVFRRKQLDDSLDESRFIEEIAEISETLNWKGDQYRHEPMELVPPETLDHLILMKAYRIIESTDEAQKRDSIIDLISYGILRLNRANNEEK